MKDDTRPCLKDTEPNNDKILKDYAECIAKREKFVKYDVTVAKITKKGDGYLATPYEIDIKGATADGEKEVNLFVKNIIANDTFGGFFSIKEAYNRECYFYKELSKIFSQLQEGKVPKGDKLNMVKGYEESTSEAIIMDNATKKGYKTLNRMEVVAPLKFIELALEQLAKIHGLGFVIHEEMPEYFNDNIAIKEFPMIFNEEWKKIARSAINITVKNLNPVPRKKAEGFVPKILSKLEEYYRDKSSIRTLCHGDFRVMNLLMKEINGEVTEVIPIDYQIIYYGCPATDVLYLLYGSTDLNLRKQHYKRLINLYYDTLSRFLKYFEIDVKDVYPRKEFDAAIERRSEFGLMMALYFYPLFFAPDDDVPEITEDFTTKHYKLDSEIMKKVEEIIEEFEEAGLL